MNIVFENLSKDLNFVNCNDVNKSGIRRFSPSPMLTTLLRYRHKRESIFHARYLPHYIIPTGVNHAPEQWIGDYNNSVLKNLNPVYLEDIKQGRALLALDQSLEGYQTDWLWKELHKDCSEHGISPKALIYITGNSLAPKQYKEWCVENNVVEQLKVIAYEHFEIDVRHSAKERGISYTWSIQLAYKKAHNIKTFNCLNRRTRPHRIWFYTKLYQNNLLKDGLVSMNQYHVWPLRIDGQLLDLNIMTEALQTLPLEIYGKANSDKDDHFYIRRIFDQVYLDSYVSVVSEPQYGEEDLSVFCSEKIFKSIVSLHPFIIVGGKGSLARLRELGYKTFDGFIDESYDTLDSIERFDAIIDAIKKINAIEDKLSWFESMKDILEHNYNLLMSRETSQACVELEQYYNEYFNV